MSKRLRSRENRLSVSSEDAHDSRGERKPDRFTRKATAEPFARGCTKPHYVVVVDENPDGIIEGWYVVCPADAERLHRETDGLITYAT